MICGGLSFSHTGTEPEAEGQCREGNLLFGLRYVVRTTSHSTSSSTSR